jgi:hypothetical protein
MISASKRSRPTPQTAWPVGLSFHVHTQGYFCDVTRRNAVPEVPSQKDTNWNPFRNLFSRASI